MWVNFKPGQNDEESRNTTPAVGLSRQNSSRSSRKSSTSTSHLQRKIEEYCFKQNTEEWKKQQEYNERRRKRKLMKKQMVSELKLKRARRLHIPASICILVGIILTLGACLRSISEGTFMWEYREVFRIAGPSLLCVGIIILMTAVALDGYIKDKYKVDKKPPPQPFIHPDFHLPKPSISRQASSATTCELDNSFQPLLKQDGDRSKCKWFEFSHFNRSMKNDDSEWNSSISSNTTSQDSQQSAHKWSHSVSISISEESDNAFCIPHDDSINQFKEYENNSEPIKIYNVNNAHENALCDYQWNLQSNCRPESVLCEDTRYTPETLVTQGDDMIEQQYLERCVSNDTTVI